MPKPCFSYPADVPPDIPDRAAAEAARRDLRMMPQTCYSYPQMCFSYPDDILRGAGSSAADQAPAPGLRGMPFGSCFRY